MAMRHNSPQQQNQFSPLHRHHHARQQPIQFRNILTACLLAVVVVETWLVAHFHSLYTQTVSGPDQQLVGAAGGDSWMQPARKLAAGHSSTSPTAGGGATGAGSNQEAGPLLPSLTTNQFYRQRIDSWERAPNGSYLPSSWLAPMRITVCTHRMPTHWAPCIRIGGVDIEYAEQVIYPAHKVRLPGFMREADREEWVRVIGSRGLAVKEDHQYVAMQLTGQNFIFRNARYTNNPFPDTWTDQNTHCMGYQGEIQQFQSTQPQPGDSVHEQLFLVNTPQAFSFQHFTDHVFKVVIQSMHLLTPETDILAGDTVLPSVREMYRWFQPINASHIIFGKEAPGMFAQRLVHACRCPFWAPYNIQRWQEMALGPDAAVVPMEQRKVLLYYSRSGPDPTIMNGGRRVLNEGELVARIRQLLAARGQGEVLEMLDTTTWGTYQALAQHINQNVRAIVGPHGGGLMNLLWAARDTLVVEYQLKSHVNYAMWELSPLLEHNYWVLVSQDQGFDMLVDIDSTIKVLDQELGHVQPRGFYLDLDSDWPKSLIGM